MSASELIGWTLIHSLWQGVLIVGGVALLLAVLRRHDPRLRYLVCCGGLVLMFVVPIASVVLGAHALNHGALKSLATLVGSAAGVAGWAPVVTTFTAILWFGGATSFLFRSLVRWLRARALVRRGVRPAARELQDASRRICGTFSIRRPIEIMTSTLAEVPTVIGWIRPVVLLPVSALIGLSPEQLQMVIAHELAHVARRDYLVNLIQVVVESLMFYHPGVWWLSERIRIEREYCCDDLAVRACGSPVRYARTLASLEESRDIARTHAMAATGGSLLDRIARMASGGKTGVRGALPPLQGLVITVVLVVVAIVFGFSTSNSVSLVPETAGHPMGIRVPASANEASDDDRQPRRRARRTGLLE